MSAAAPLVSVLSAYYNRREHVTESVGSLLAQTYPNLEIIIIDDGSTDGTGDALRALQDPRLKVVSTANQGFVRAIRHAVELSKGELIAIHGSGDISFPTRIEKQAAFLGERPEVGVVGCHVELVDHANQTLMIGKPEIRADMTQLLLRKCVYTHGEVMFRREVYDRVGGYRTFFKYAQDYDLWLRMSFCTAFGVVPETLYRRYNLADGVSRVSSKRVLQRYLGDVAVQCARMRILTGRDLIDLHGQDAAFFRAPSRTTAAHFLRLAASSLRRQRLEEARYFNRFSVQERRGAGNTVLELGLALSDRWTPFAQVMVRTAVALQQLKALGRRAKTKGEGNILKYG